ncbi:MAG: acetyl-CoA carboxylase biotin carboxyl carrier protein [Bacteroidetes bacterium]|nr:acetyl-CoA carboxylase biotin carboxyl carrier protein [Bacteroidota bacterium]
MKLNEIQDLIKFVAKSGVSEVELETKDVKIKITTSSKGQKGEMPIVMQANVPMMQANQPMVHNIVSSAPSEIKTSEQKIETAGAVESKLVTIKSPMIGTFYRASGPDKPIFANVGDEIKTGKVLCIIEAMKLFNEIESEISGRIVKILVDDATPVEYDQPLFLVEPA